MRRGAFITFEGGEGSGKSTQIALLAERLRAAGAEIVVTCEPGGTAVGDRVRTLVLDVAHAGMASRTELLLYEASRAELVSAVIGPALERGAVVLCDRFADSSTAYQAYGRGLPLAEVLTLNMLSTGGISPDLTLLLDLEPTEGLARAADTSAADRLESEDLVFHERVRAGFLAIAGGEPFRVRVLDASPGPDEVAQRVAGAVREAAATIPALEALPEGW